jgi:enoyl-CoA hydratase
MWRAIPVALNAFEADASVRAVVMRGAGGKAFVSGADMSEFETLRADAAGAARYDAIADGA